MDVLYCMMRLWVFTGDEWKFSTSKCCLPYDHGYGKRGNKAERKRGDRKFYRNLVTHAHMKKWCASVFLAAVRIGGTEVFGLSFSWYR